MVASESVKEVKRTCGNDLFILPPHGHGVLLKHFIVARTAP